MTDNPAYRLQVKIDAARAAADVSIDRSVHLVKNALEGVAGAEVYGIERAAHIRAHGVPDPDSFPRWSQVSREGEFDWPDSWHGFD